MPEELLAAGSPWDAAIVQWFADLVIYSATISETPALAEFKNVRFENDFERVRLLRWLGTEDERVSSDLLRHTLAFARRSIVLEHRASSFCVMRRHRRRRIHNAPLI